MHLVLRTRTYGCSRTSCGNWSSVMRTLLYPLLLKIISEKMLFANSSLASTRWWLLHDCTSMTSQLWPHKIHEKKGHESSVRSCGCSVKYCMCQQFCNKCWVNVTFKWGIFKRQLIEPIPCGIGREPWSNRGPGPWNSDTAGLRNWSNLLQRILALQAHQVINTTCHTIGSHKWSATNCFNVLITSLHEPFIIWCAIWYHLLYNNSIYLYANVCDNKNKLLNKYNKGLVTA